MLETSVCRTSIATDLRVRQLGQTIRSDRKALAIAIAQAGLLPRELRCVEAPEPSYHEHAVILGWPDGDDAKSARMSLQQEIAAAAEPLLFFES